MVEKNNYLTEQDKKKNLKYNAIFIGGLVTIALFYLFGYTGSMAQLKNLDMLNAFLLTMEEIAKWHLLYPLNGMAISGMFFALFCGGLFIFVYYISCKRNYSYDSDKIYGDAHFQSEEERKEYQKKYEATNDYIDPVTKGKTPHAYPDMILSEQTKRNLDDRATKRNNNVVVIGGAGTGKSRFFIKPNILQENCSFVITDPSGEILVSLGWELINNGYKVKIFNTSDMAHSNTYNPLNYIRNEAGVLMLVDCLIKNTTGKGQKGDEFFTNAERLLYSACIFYLLDFETNPAYKNFGRVMDMINMSNVDENNANAKSKLDLMFDDIKKDSLASKYYRAFKQAAGKTLKSIIISCVVRLQPFMTPQVNNLTKSDNIELGNVGNEKTAIFIIVPQADRTFAFLASMFYSQLFETLYYIGEQKKIKTGSERLPYHVRCMMDEFANSVTRSTPKTVGITDKSVA